HRRVAATALGTLLAAVGRKQALLGATGILHLPGGEVAAHLVASRASTPLDASTAADAQDREPANNDNRKDSGLIIERNNAFVAIWKPPVVGPLPLRPGMSGKDVGWLRQRLTQIEGQPAPASPGQVYDDELRRRVAAFQQARSLMPDGIAGEETLVRLAGATPGSNGPSLSRARP